MKLLNFKIIKLTICLILGIVIGQYLNCEIRYIIIALAIVLLTFTFIFTYCYLKNIRSLWFGYFAFISMIAVGVLLIKIQDERLQTRAGTLGIDSES